MVQSVFNAQNIVPRLQENFLRRLKVVTWSYFALFQSVFSLPRWPWNQAPKSWRSGNHLQTAIKRFSAVLQHPPLPQEIAFLIGLKKGDAISWKTLLGFPHDYVIQSIWQQVFNWYFLSFQTFFRLSFHFVISSTDAHAVLFSKDFVFFRRTIQDDVYLRVFFLIEWLTHRFLRSHA